MEAMLLWYLFYTVQLSDVYDKQSLMFGTEAGVLWYRPSSLKELLSMKERLRHARLVSGATAVGQSMSFAIFVLLTHYIPNTAKEEYNDISVRSMNIDDRQPPSHFGKFQMAISLQRVVRSTLCMHGLLGHYTLPPDTTIHHCLHMMGDSDWRLIISTG